MADDYAGNTSTLGRLASGNSLTGSIEVAYDRDWFAITLNAGAQYTFRLDGAATGGLSDPLLTLYNASGGYLTSNDDANGYNSQILYTPAVTGAYFLAASGYSTAAGTYILSAAGGASGDDFAGNSSTGGQLAVGGSVSGSIEASTDHDWFAITLAAGQRYVFNLDPASSGALADPYLRLYASGSGALVASDDDSGPGYASEITYTATSSGTYFLDAAAYGSGTGAYRLTAASAGTPDDYAATASTAGRLSPGATISGRLEVAGDNDWFTISLSAGQRYTFNLNPAASGGLSDPYLSLYNSSGTLLSANDDTNGLASQIVFDATSAGTYFLGARAYGSLTGNYTLSASAGVALDDYAGNTSTSGGLAPGNSTTGRIEAGDDSDWFAINLVAGQRYVFNLDPAASGGLADPILGLYSGSGSLLASNDDANGLASQVVYTAGSSGTYYLAALAAYSNMTGAYVLRASAGESLDDYAADAATAGRLTVGGTSAGQIERVGDNDWFAISLTAGQRYTFNLDPATSGGLSDPYLNLYNGSGTLLASNDDANGRASQITYAAAASGIYFLGARAYSSETGAYVLRASAAGTSDDYAANTGTAGHLVVGGSASGRIETSDDNDWFAITLSAGQQYRFNLNAAASSGLGDPYLALYGASGALLASNDDANGTAASEITFTATTGGTYYLGARGYGSSTGNYQLAASAVGQTASGYSIDIVFSGGGQYQSYFTAAAQRWASVITGDLPNVGGIDDLQISASVSAIDGVGGTLGQAGARGIRSGSNLPYSGVMQFDQADVDGMIAKGTFGDVVLHEMGHILGFSGYFFNLLGLLNPNNPYQYTGANAVREYQRVNPRGGSFVPIEESGGSGTAGSHWSESLFNAELMTGYAENAPPMPLSIVTIGALQDLGYSVNYAAANSFAF